MESLFAKPELSRIRSKFLHVASDFSGEKRLFFDNAGGSLRLARAEQAFAHVDSIPDCSEHSNRVARHLDGFEREGRRDLMGYVFDLERICHAARKANPDIIILCDAVQHAPHAALDPEAFGIDAMTFAPYKFFGVRGFAVAYISDRCASFMHHRLLAKAADDWSLGSPTGKA